MIEIGSFDDQKYHDYKILNSSNRSCVIRALDKDLTPVLLKFFMKIPNNDSFITDPDYNQIIPRELFYLMRLTGNEYVPKLLNYHDNDHTSIVVMEFLGNDWMDLFQYTLSNNAECIIREIVVKIIVAIYEPSKNEFYHRNIKPENVMINTATLEIKLIDFEHMFYSELENPFCQSTVGTIGYKSPESFNNNCYNLKSSLVFNIGCLVYSCIENKSAFVSQEDTITCKRLEMTCSPRLAASFISKCTTRNVEERMNFHDLLRDEWFSY